MFPVTAEEKSAVQPSHLTLLQSLFTTDMLSGGQLLFFWAYNFEFIPIELISAIYEEFLHQEESGQDSAYYTPPNYASGNSWGGMIGYVLTGNHTAIVEKLNMQIDRQLQDPSAQLKLQPPVHNFDAIYASSHQHPSTAKPLVIRHLLLSFC